MTDKQNIKFAEFIALMALYTDLGHFLVRPKKKSQKPTLFHGTDLSALVVTSWEEFHNLKLTFDLIEKDFERLVNIVLEKSVDQKKDETTEIKNQSRCSQTLQYVSITQLIRQRLTSGVVIKD